MNGVDPCSRIVSCLYHDNFKAVAWLIVILALLLLSPAFRVSAEPSDARKHPADVRWEEYTKNHSNKEFEFNKRISELCRLDYKNFLYKFEIITDWSDRPLIYWGKQLLLHDYWLLFAQPDGSLTRLELETGRVLARDRFYWKASDRNKYPMRIRIVTWTRREAYAIGQTFNHSSIYVDLKSGNAVTKIDGDLFCPDSLEETGPPQSTERKLWAFAKIMRDRFKIATYPQACVELPGGGYSWIECDPENCRATLRYRDATRSWSGTIRITEEIVNMLAANGSISPFGMAGDDQHIVYLVANGKMECVDRFSGESKWIYVFPMRYIISESESRKRGENRFRFSSVGLYFTEKAIDCDDNLIPGDIYPLLVDGRLEPSRVPIVVDPAPDPGHMADVLLPGAISSLSPFVLLLCLWLLWKIPYRGGRILAALIILIASLFLINHFGGYSRFSCLLTAGIVCGSLGTLVYLWKIDLPMVHSN